MLCDLVADAGRGDSADEDDVAVSLVGRVRDVSGDDPKAMGTLLNLYVQQATELLPALDAAVQSKSAPEVNLIAHKLRGASLTCGANSIAMVLQQLEHLGGTGDVSKAEPLCHRAGNEFARLKDFLATDLPGPLGIEV